MKKTFKLNVENKKPERQIESIKHEIRKYIQREKRKKLPEDMNFWQFDCKFAMNDETPKTIEFTQVTKCIDDAYENKADTLYMEIISKATFREKKEKKTEDEVQNEE